MLALLIWLSGLVNVSNVEIAPEAVFEVWYDLPAGNRIVIQDINNSILKNNTDPLRYIAFKKKLKLMKLNNHLGKMQRY